MNLHSTSNLRSVVGLWLGLLLLLLVPAVAFCDELVNSLELPTSAATPGSFEGVINELDTPRDYLSGKLVGFVKGVDSFFGSERNFQESNDSVFQLDTSRVMGYGGEHNFVVSAMANVRLPSAEKQLHLVFETDPDKNAIIDPTLSQLEPANEPATPKSIAAALRFVMEDTERWHLSTDAGLKFHGLSSAPFVRARASFAVPMDKWQLNLTETAFWFNTIGAGETTQLELDRSISESLLFRSTSAAAWLNDTQNFDLRQNLTVFQEIDERTAMEYQASVVGVSNPVTQVTDNVISVLYRYRLHQQWMYFNFNPQMHFPRDRNFQLSPQLNLKLEMLFDESNPH
jgi:hypothetical protein